MRKGVLLISMLISIILLLTCNPFFIASNSEKMNELPDLTVYYVHVNSTNFVISAGIQNLGGVNVTTSVAFYDAFLLFGVIPLFERKITTVEPLFIPEYGAAEIAIVWDSPYFEHPILNHRITVFADPDNVIEESDETNNWRSIDVYIPIW